MNPINGVKVFATKAIKNVKADSPTILTALGIVGFVGTCVLVAKETPKAVVDLERAEQDKKSELKPVEKAKILAKNYWPAAATGIGSIACFVGANHISILRVQAAMAAYRMSENRFAEYQDKVVEKFGAKKEESVRTDIAQDHVNRNPAPTDPALIPHGKGGNQLCYDIKTGRYFYSDMQTLKAIVNVLNRQFDCSGGIEYGEGVVTLNDFYDHVGLPTIPDGDNWVWSIEKTGLIEPTFSSMLTDIGTPVLTVDWETEPIFIY